MDQITGQIEKMRSKIGNDSRSIVPPRRVPDLMSGPISVKETNRDHIANFAATKRFPEPLDGGVKTMVIRRVTNGPV